MTKKNVTWGVLAHVDAGKTTFIESTLLNAGMIREAGRVDKGNAFLDTNQMEKDRGITIFSKQAVIDRGQSQVTLMDTPGHVDFSAEMERTLRVLDGAILIIGATDGIQSHTRTLWRLLKEYDIPTVIFVNKMDQPDTEADTILKELESGLKGDFVPWDLESEDCHEAIAMCDEAAMEEFLEAGRLEKERVKQLFYKRGFFPVLFGSALKNEGVDRVQTCMDFFEDAISMEKQGAKREIPEDIATAFYCFKISHDDSGEKISHIKVLRGGIQVKDTLGDEKIHGIRVYNGLKYESVDMAEVGLICAITGPSQINAGDNIFIDSAGNVEKSAVASPLLVPVLSYRLILPEGCDMAQAIKKLNQLAQEDPDLALEYEEETKQINVKLMGEIQTEIITRRIKERFNLDVSFGESRIIYKETIKGPVVEGVGHFEPLRHYAEAHLLLEAGEPGSGITVERDCSEDILDLNWQRLIITHINERTHRGVLTGSPITDIKFTVVSGKAHPKHTEGGDFRQATYRAIRNGLMQAESVLLEPFYDFTLRIPTNFVGRAMTDLERMYAADFLPETEGDYTVLKGKAPAACIQGYGATVLSYTSGLGELSLTLNGYGPCHNAEEVIAQRGYDLERDVRNTGDSVFCSHGSGVIVPWNQVKEHMHMPSALKPIKELTDEQIRQRAKREVTSTEPGFLGYEEVDAILAAATHANKKGDVKPDNRYHKKNISKEWAAGNTKSSSDNYTYKPQEKKPDFLLVDGYNVIFAWNELNSLALRNIDSARDSLLDKMCAYQAVCGKEIIVVFDAYRVANHSEEYSNYNNIHVVFTKTAETADHYIERFVREKSKDYRSTVVTSDGMEQIIVRGAGAGLISSREFEARVKVETEEFNARFGIM